MKRISWNMTYGIAALLGAISFIVLYGTYVLNPFYTEWLTTGGDLTQHYLGWEYFRKSDWYFPIGLTNQIAYPLKTSVIYTDSIPLFAVVFKVLISRYDGRFQYFGLWGMCCFMLQGYLAAKIIQYWIKDKWQVLLGSLLFIWSPVVIFRMYYHTSLAAHWLILISLYLWVVHKDNYQKVIKTSLQWGMIGILIASIHLYFVPMCGALLGGYILFSFIEERKIKIRYFLPGVAFLTGLLGTMTLLGGFSSNVSSGSSDGLGYFSFNLNGFFNPIGYSKIMKWLEVYKEGQYEGFAYLGLGIIILLGFAILSYLISLKKYLQVIKENWMKIVISVGVILGLTLLAASHKITFNEYLLFELPDIDIMIDYWSIFRSSGRLIWPVYYVVFLTAIIKVLKLFSEYSQNKIVVYSVLIITFVVQMYDMSDKLIAIHNNYAQIISDTKVFDGDLWNKMEEKNYEHVFWVSHNIDKEIMLFADWALEHDMTMSNFYFARSVDVREQRRKEMQRLTKDTLYVFKPGDKDEVEDYNNYVDELYMYESGGYIIGSVLPID